MKTGTAIANGTLLAELWNDTMPFENSFQFHIKDILTIWYSTSLLYIYPREMKTCIYTKAYLYENIDNSVIHISKVEPTQMSLDWWMRMHTVIYLYNRILLSTKKKQLTDHNITIIWMHLKTLCQVKIARHKRLHSIPFHLYDLLSGIGKVNQKW